MIPLALWIMATVDAAFAGFRDAAGRDPRISKARYYRRAVGLGALAGQLNVLLVGLIIGGLLVGDPHAPALYAALIDAGRRMLEVYAVYGAAICTAFALYAIPSINVRCLATVAIFGPLTLLRPLVIAAGAIRAAIDAPPVVGLVAALAASGVTLLEPALGRLRRRRPT